MNPVGVGTSIIQQALPSPITPMSPYALVVTALGV